MIKFIQAIFQHSDKNVRVEGANLVLELARWIGAAIGVCFEGLKPVQVKELQEQISKLQSTPARPIRWRRCEQPSAEATSTQFGMITTTDTATVLGASSGSVAEIIDSYALSEPVNVLDKIPAELGEALDSSKWKDRKDALDSLLSIIKVPKIEDGHFGSVVNMLVKRIGDVNVLVVTTAAQCLEAIASGLRKSFSNYRGEAIPALLERCKEKNKAVIEALRKALDATVHSISSVSEFAEAYGVFLKHKNPQVKSETIAWISRCIPRVFRQQQGKKEIKALTDVLVPCMEDSTADVRDVTATALAALIRVATEKQVMPFLDKLDKIKLTKVMDIVNAEGVAIAQPADVSSAPTSRKPSLGVSCNSGPLDPPLVKAKPKTLVGSKPAQTQAQIPTVKKTLANLTFSHTNEDSIDIMRNFLGDSVVDGLLDSNWKTRLASMDSIIAKFESLFPQEITSEILVRFFAARPGWRDSNFQVLTKVLSLLTMFAEKRSFTAEAASISVPGVAEKIADAKLGTGVALFFSAVAERVGISLILECLEESIKSQKNPKALGELFNWITFALLDFGVAGLDIKATVAITKIGLANSNLTVRTLAIKMVVTLGRFIGPDLKSMYNDLTGPQLSILQSEFEKIAADPIPIPIKRIREPETSSNAVATTEDLTVKMDALIVPPPPSLEDFVPRADLTSELAIFISELSDMNWKVRKEAMDKSLNAISKAGNRIKLLNSDFLSELRGRYNDSNKNLIVQALELTGALATALGPAFEKSGGLRIVLAPAVATLADNKPQVRTAAVKFLSASLEVSSLGSMAGVLAVSLSTDSPNLRRELLTWLGENAVTLVKASEEDRNALVLAIFGCLQDRAVEVRKAASLFLDAAIDVFSGDFLLRLCQASKPTLFPQLKQIIDAHQPKATAIAAEQVPSPFPNPTQVQVAATPKTPQKGQQNPSNAGGKTPKKISESQGSTGCIFLTTDPQVKAARIDSETKSGFKWHFDAPRNDFCESLRGQMANCIASSVIKQLFADDFRDVITGMTAIDSTITSNAEKDGLIANTDLILKYITIRLFETNTSVLIKTFDLIEHTLAVIDEANLRLNEAEAGIFLPHFVQRAGEMKEPLKGRLRGNFRQLCRVYPASKIFGFLIEGLKSKNARARVECLCEMEVLISRNGLMVVQAAKHIPLIAAVISDKDSQVRSASLNVLVRLHELLNDVIYKHMAGIPQKDLDLFQERLRRFKDNKAMDIDEPPHHQESHQSHPNENQPSELITISNNCATANPTRGDSSHEEVPQIFCLDPSQYGSPTRRATSQIKLDATPLHMGTQTAPTPAMPTLTNGEYFCQKPSSFDDPIDRVIQLINASTDLECIAALQRLDEFMATPTILLPKISPLVCALVIRLHECTHSMLDVDVSLKSRLCRYVTNALVLLATDRSCISLVDVPSLTILIRETLSALVSGQMGQFEDKEQLNRAINVLLVKILENGNQSNCYQSLLILLEQAFRVPPAIDNKYPEFVMKCLWKLTKQLANHLQAGEINVTVLLNNLNCFFCALPPVEWKTRAAQKLPLEDLPLRTVKTILHELVTVLGDRIIPNVRSLENADISFVTLYVKAMLTANNVDVSPLDFTRFPLYPLSSGVERPVDTFNTLESTLPLSLEHLEERLKDICSKICSKPNTRVGLTELYELQQTHMHAAKFIDQYLERLGNFFYKYIKRNLAHIEAEMNSSNTFEATDSMRAPAESYKNRLAQIHHHMQMGKGAAGLVGDENEHSNYESNGCKSTMIKSPVRNRLDSPITKTMSRTPTRTLDANMEGTPVKDSTIVSLKERLARLRQSGEQ